MRRIFTSFLAFALFTATSFTANAQCTFSTTAPTGAPGVQNTFDAGSEGFTGSFTWTGTSGSPSMNLLATSSPAELITPVYYLTPGSTQMIVRINLIRSGNVTITGYTITAETNANPSIALCSATGLNITPATNNGTVYYFTIPTTGLSTGVNFKNHITFTYTGNGNLMVDNFGSTATFTNATLPVKFATFEARTASSNVSLTWKVAVEDNVSGYDVERSVDGRSFTKIGFVAATGKGLYSYADTKPLSSSSYYRVKSVDVDGKYSYSSVASLKGGKSSIVLKAFPLPAQNNITLQHATALKGSKIVISTEDGRVLTSIVPAIGTQQTEINLSSARPGLYLVRFDNSMGEIETLKVVKQ